MVFRLDDMNKQTVDLGYVLKQFPKYDFTMKGFDDRLRLQKFIYLLQAHGIYLGYDFSWYLHGPYCTTLARRGFALERIYKEVPGDEVWFESPQVQDRFAKFKDAIVDKIADVKFLEVAASLHILKLSGMSDEDACAKVSKKKQQFNIPYCQKVLEDFVKPLLEDVQTASLPALNEKQITLDAFADSDDLANDRDMDYKYVDKAVYYMLKDAANADFHLVGKNAFRPGERRPNLDLLVVDKANTIQLLARD